MDLEAFEASLTRSTPPPGLLPALEALWHERRGDWTRAHEMAQEIAGPDGAWVHAYVHRREGTRCAKPLRHFSTSRVAVLIVGRP